VASARWERKTQRLLVAGPSVGDNGQVSVHGGKTSTGLGPARSARWGLAVGGGLVLLALAAIVVVLEPWHGPILVSLVSGRGLDAGDLVIVPLVATAVLLLAHRSESQGGTEAGSSARAATRSGVLAIGLGSLILVGQAVRLADLDEHIPPVAYLLSGLIVLGAVCLAVEVVTAPSARAVLGERTRLSVVALLVFVGLVVDAALSVHGGTVFCVVLPALYLIAVVDSRPLAVGLGVLVIALIGLTVLSLTDLLGVDVQMARDEGGVARAVALGVLLLGVGFAVLHTEGAGAARHRRSQEP
jgi:hypothetical protein